jgi:FtsP/CotA-like multicopper oxidase with cupredoxin domain
MRVGSFGSAASRFAAVMSAGYYTVAGQTPQSFRPFVFTGVGWPQFHPAIQVQCGSNFAAHINNRLTNDLVMHGHSIVAPPNRDGRFI